MANFPYQYFTAAEAKNIYPVEGNTCYPEIDYSRRLYTPMDGKLVAFMPIAFCIYGIVGFSGCRQILFVKDPTGSVRGISFLGRHFFFSVDDYKRFICGDKEAEVKFHYGQFTTFFEQEGLTEGIDGYWMWRWDQSSAAPSQKRPLTLFWSDADGVHYELTEKYYKSAAECVAAHLEVVDFNDDDDASATLERDYTIPVRLTVKAFTQKEAKDKVASICGAALTD